jgi:hypothetical protein
MLSNISTYNLPLTFSERKMMANDDLHIFVPREILLTTQTENILCSQSKFS